MAHRRLQYSPMVTLDSALVTRWWVTVLMNFPTQSPPVYRAAPCVGSVWFVVQQLGCKVTPLRTIGSRGNFGK